MSAFKIGDLVQTKDRELFIHDYGKQYYIGIIERFHDLHSDAAYVRFTHRHLALRRYDIEDDSYYVNTSDLELIEEDL